MAALIDVSKRYPLIEIDTTARELLKGLSVRYQAKVQDLGFTDICRDGEFCGTRGQSKRIEGIRVYIVRKS